MRINTPSVRPLCAAAAVAIVLTLAIADANASMMYFGGTDSAGKQIAGAFEVGEQFYEVDAEGLSIWREYYIDSFKFSRQGNPIELGQNDSFYGPTQPLVLDENDWYDGDYAPSIGVFGSNIELAVNYFSGSLNGTISIGHIIPNGPFGRTFVTEETYTISKLSESFAEVFVYGGMKREFDGPDAKFEFTPNFGVTLRVAAELGGFSGFNWQQTVDELPSPSPFRAVLYPNLPLVAPPSFLDPVQGGYTYDPTQLSYPFYYSALDLQYKKTDFTLKFKDTPANKALYGGVSFDFLEYKTAPKGADMKFTTYLVGVNHDGTPSDPLYWYKWGSNFNGTAGGTMQLSGRFDADPGSGTGGAYPLDASVPEPATLAIVGLGLAMLVSTQVFGRSTKTSAASSRLG